MRALMLGALAGALLPVVPAAAESEQMVMGLWCGNRPDGVRLTYEFSRDLLRVD
jgi:hypothetical protein